VFVSYVCDIVDGIEVTSACGVVEVLTATAYHVEGLFVGDAEVFWEVVLASVEDIFSRFPPPSPLQRGRCLRFNF